MLISKMKWNITGCGSDEEPTSLNSCLSLASKLPFWCALFVTLAQSRHTKPSGVSWKLLPSGITQRL